MRLLYVEDNPIALDRVCYQLAQHAPHIRVTTVKTLAQARDHLERNGHVLADPTQIHRVFMNLGYQVTTQTDNRNALALFQDHPNQFDIVITDMTMPELSGDRLAAKMLAIRPGLPVISCTGYSKKISTEKINRIGVHSLVMKPSSNRNMLTSARPEIGKSGRDQGARKILPEAYC